MKNKSMFDNEEKLILETMFAERGEFVQRIERESQVYRTFAGRYATEAGFREHITRRMDADPEIALLTILDYAEVFFDEDSDGRMS